MRVNTGLSVMLVLLPEAPQQTDCLRISLARFSRKPDVAATLIAKNDEQLSGAM